MDKPSKTKYAITNRTRQILTLSFVALGSFLVFSGSKCNETTKLSYVVVELAAGGSAMDTLEECVIDGSLGEGSISVGSIAVPRTRLYANILSSVLLQNSLYQSPIPSASNWSINEIPPYTEGGGLCKRDTYHLAMRGGDTYYCSFDPMRGPAPFTTYNCGYTVIADIRVVGEDEAPATPPTGASIYLRANPFSGLPNGLYATLPITASEVTITVPTSLPIGAYTMTSTDGLDCRIVDSLYSNILTVDQNDEKKVAVTINCVVKSDQPPS